MEGIGWTYAGRSAKSVVDETLASVVVGGDILSVPGQHEAMVRACRNLGRPGLAACAISAVDIALWDLKARSLDLPLCDLFGQARSEVPVYGSGGFTTYDDPTTAGQLEGWVDEPAFLGSRSRSARPGARAPNATSPEWHSPGRWWVTP